MIKGSTQFPGITWTSCLSSAMPSSTLSPPPPSFSNETKHTHSVLESPKFFFHIFLISDWKYLETVYSKTVPMEKWQKRRTNVKFSSVQNKPMCEVCAFPGIIKFGCVLLDVAWNMDRDSVYKPNKGRKINNRIRDELKYYLQTDTSWFDNHAKYKAPCSRPAFVWWIQLQ